MEIKDIMRILEEDMGIAVFSTIDAQGQPHGRYINIGVANEDGIFFMTSPKNDFYKQLEANPKVAITGLNKADNLLQVIRVEGEVRPLGREKLAEVLENNPYVEAVYPTEADRSQVQALQVYKGTGFYQSLTQGHKYVFDF